ncbi:ImmA/IrrE family metallo-endopeptidase [Dictyobacter halimunensis]|uniref:ImmA/IrrE family metallo-endopeptidase n=1 Tax=Dictyobacter halimunensis TaxID=3026934 RepID=UPI003B97DBE1
MRGLERSLRDWCENEGVRWRRELGLYAYDPLPSQRLAQHLEIPVFSPTEIPGIEAQILQRLLEEESAWSAITLPVSQGKHIVIYNPTHATTRHESDVMHELAHLLLGHQPIRFHQVSGTIPVREYRTADEKAAEYLGGCLQITARGLDWAFQRNMTRREIAKHFGASSQMVRYRCNMTGYSKR